VTARAVKEVHMLKAYRLHEICDLKYKYGKNGMGRSGGIEEREGAGRNMGSQMNWVQLWSTLICCISKSPTSFTRDLMLLGVASAYCEKF